MLACDFICFILQLWVVSNCKATFGAARRMDYAQSLVDAGLPVHRYGGCFNNREKFSELTRAELNSFKFYLAFENSQHCTDYITEKFWEMSLNSGRVPVVWGPLKRDVEKVAPTGSYIHTDDFQTPKQLVQYLLYLDKHDEEYRKFFSWRENPDSRTITLINSMSTIPEKFLCDKLQKATQKKVVDSVPDIIYGNERQECMRMK